MRLNEVAIHPAFQDMIEKIPDECSDILELYRSNRRVLFRGSNSRGSFYYDEPREDRRPSDSTPELQIAFDTYLASKGFTALRSNSAFCTNGYDHAAAYGLVSVVFPRNGFTYTWTNAADSVLTPYKASKYPNLEAINAAETVAEKNPNENGQRWRWIDALGIDVNVRRLRSCKLPGYEDAKMVDFIDIPRFAGSYRPKKTQLEKAIDRTPRRPKGWTSPSETGFEIMINGPFYGISVDYESVLTELLGFDISLLI